jgi:hypothetical protein
VTRRRAADDFPAIRARMEELRRERAQTSADDKPRSVSGSRPYSGSRPATADTPRLLPAILRAMERA